MNLKQRFSLYFSLLFSLVLAAVLIAVYMLFSKYRQEEFETRLVQRAETTFKIWAGSTSLNSGMLEIFDRNRANKLTDEKTSIYDHRHQVIYTSNNKIYFTWSNKDFKLLSLKTATHLRRNNYDIVGKRFRRNGTTYYVVASALDNYDITKMQYLKLLLLFAFLFGTVSIFLLSFYVSKAGLKPLDILKEQILEISERNLQQRVDQEEGNDEISQLSRAFNQMMDRIDTAYKHEKEFTANASHELRTPLARITSQIQNFIKKASLTPSDKEIQLKVLQDTHQLSEIVTSLLILSEIEGRSPKSFFKILRLDEVIFSVVSDFTIINPELKFNFDIIASSDAVSIDIYGDEILLKVAFTNLVKNAYSYSDNKTISCTINVFDNTIRVELVNSGQVPNVEDPLTLFNTFTRGSNSSEVPGSGVGLSLVNRILRCHNASLDYKIVRGNLNTLSATFTRSLFRAY